jgi:flavodoxin
MFNVAIIYAPEDADIHEYAQQIHNEFKKSDMMATLKKAGKASIPDIAAADIVVFGSKEQEKDPIHSDFSQLIRSFSGVNLAGRAAAFFIMENSSTLSEFKKVLNDSDIHFYKPPLYIKKDEQKANTKAIAKWVKDVYKSYKEMMHGRKI